MNNITCKQCGKEVEKKSKNQKYCSKECFEKVYPKKEQNNKCSYCKKVFKRKNNRQKFCSTVCMEKAKPSRKKNIVKYCEECGNEFKTHINKERFCSQSCSAKHVQNITKIKKCVQCGKEFDGKKGQIYCSQECKYEQNKTKLNHEKNCPKCGNNFKTNGASRKYCSYDCARESCAKYEKKEKYTCLYCQNEFKPKLRRTSTYCSHECANNHKSDLSKLRHARLDLIKTLNKISNKKRCLCCTNMFIPSNIATVVCSDDCRKEYDSLKSLYNAMLKHIPGRHTCKTCGNIFSTEYGDKSRGIYCSDGCSRKYNRRVGKALRRARIKGNEYERIDPISIFIRDEWTCQMCGVSTPYELRGTWEDDAPELDHVVPIALGGTHTIDNVQCSCRKCNQSKGAKLFVE